MITRELINWLLESPEPWTRYRTRIDLLGQDPGSSDVKKARLELLNHPAVIGLIKKCDSWPEYPLTRHNDANHPLHSLSVLADIGLSASDPGMSVMIDKIKSRQSPEGPFETQIKLYKRFGGLDGEYWTWMACDAPVILYSLASFGLGKEQSVILAKDHLLQQITDNGWRCGASPMLKKFKGPGRREHPCPIANVYALKALSQFPELIDDPSLKLGINMLLNHWKLRKEKKYYLFGMGTDFKKLKYPHIWYDILHVVDVLSRFPAAISSPVFQEMREVITSQVDSQGRFTATSMYRAWKDWSFANKKEPSPWLTFIVMRLLFRSGYQIDG